MTWRRMLAVLVLLTSFAIWIPAPDIVYLVAEWKVVLLGRYSENHFLILVLLTSLLWVLAWLLFSGRVFDRELALQTIMIALSSLLAVVLTTVVSTIVIPKRYVTAPVYFGNQQRQELGKKSILENVALTLRPPKLRLSFSFEDVPLAGRRFYPGNSRGFPPINGTLSTDDSGFRNQHRENRYDLVVAGDSFTEGSNVSDDAPWPVVLARSSGYSVYNLGISGMAPRGYLNNFVGAGLELRPRTFIAMFYEGNDFVASSEDKAKTPAANSINLGGLIADSPVRSVIDSALIRAFSPIRANAPLPQNEALSFMPVAITVNGVTHFYAFKAHMLRDFMVTREKFVSTRAWQSTADVIRQMQAVSQYNGIRFILVYVPHKARVVMPLIRNNITDHQLHEFIGLTSDDLPPEAGFRDYWFTRMDSKETVIRDFCRANHIEFISTTQLLRDRILRGDQVYFTYDDHWTPEGHRVVGEALAGYLRETRDPGARTASRRAIP